MSLYYITGVAGSGKSAVCKELAARGYDAVEADDELCAFYDNETGEKVHRPEKASDRTPEWRSRHTWKMSRTRLLELKEKTKNKPVFVCGVASNEAEIIDLFDRIFALDTDIETIKQRIKLRPDGAFGKSKHEMVTLTEWHRSSKEYFTKIHALTIDASKSVSNITDTILASINNQ